VAGQGRDVAVQLTVAEHTGVRQLPGQWPAGLAPPALSAVEQPTPFLLCDLAAVRARIAGFRAALPGVRPFYAVKCNPSPQLLDVVARASCGFEVASIGELRLLQAAGVDPSAVLYSNTVKPAGHVAAAAAAGLWRFGFDSEGELHKIARNAPGSAVYVRLRVDDSAAAFPLSRKFGVQLHAAQELLRKARSLGLVPYGLTFHVGSQCASAAAWRRAIAASGRLLARLRADGIRLEMLDIGGGFPARYGEAVPAIGEIGAVIQHALAELLPYRPPLLAAEPGRHLVAESAVLATTVIGRERRADEEWLYVDVGAYNGLMETQQAVGQWPFPLWTSRPDHATAVQMPFTVTGPTCDPSDTMFYGASLPATIAEGDRLYIGSAGAYTLSYASSFNGFPPPTPLFLDSQA
jgi:ornithine decarboxylase